MIGPAICTVVNNFGALGALAFAASAAASAAEAAAIPVVPPPLLAAPQALKKPLLEFFDCQAEYEFWQQAWTPEWKKWCCENHNKGCPSTATSSSTETSTRTATATSTSDTTTTQTATGTTSKTATSSSHTSSTRTTTQTNTSTSSTPDACLQSCTIDDMEATCGARVFWSSQHMTADDKSPCEAARVLVLSQCAAECFGCTVEASGCEAKLQASRPAFAFLKKFGQPVSSSEVRAELSGSRRGGRSMLPVHTAAGVAIAFVASAALAAALRSWSGGRSTQTVYRNLLDNEDSGEEWTSSGSDGET